jgi:hypothetical protein
MRTSDLKANLDTPLMTADETNAGIARFGTREEILGASDLSLIVAPQEELLLQSFRNALINGNFDFWQRGTSFIGHISGHTADRWYSDLIGSGSVDVTKENTGGLNVCENFLRMTVNTADPTLAANAYLGIVQALEGYKARVFRNSPICYSFWVRSSMPGVFSAALRLGDWSQSIVTSLTINQANTWEKKTVTAIPSMYSASPGYSGYDYYDIGLTFTLTFASGSNYIVSTPDQWEAGNKLSVAGSSNFLSSPGITIDIAEVQLEPGHTITPFEQRPYTVEEILCKTYFETGYYSHAPALAATSTIAWRWQEYDAVKKYAPTISIINPRSYSGGSWQDAASADVTPSINGFIVVHNHSAAWFIANSATLLIAQWTAESELLA